MPQLHQNLQIVRRSDHEGSAADPRDKCTYLGTGIRAYCGKGADMDR